MQRVSPGILGCLTIVAFCFPIVVLFQWWAPLISLGIGLLVFYGIRQHPETNRALWTVLAFGPAIFWIMSLWPLYILFD